MELIAFWRNKPELKAIFLAWIFMYIYAETDFPGEDYTNGVGIFDAISLGFNFLCFLVGILIVILRIIRKKFSFKGSSFVVILLLSSRWVLSSYYHSIDLGVKSALIAIDTDYCKTTGSEYLNKYGVKYCYSWIHYPRMEFIVLSNNVDLSKDMSSWPDIIVSEFEKDKKYNFLVTCGYREVHKSFSNLYFAQALCQ